MISIADTDLVTCDEMTLFLFDILLIFHHNQGNMGKKPLQTGRNAEQPWKG